jgi:hypothetical protein
MSKIEKLLARFTFVLFPALMCASVAHFIFTAPPVTGMVFTFMIALGISATKARPERGER